MASKLWDDRFLEMAKLVASWSKDISTKVGAVITDSDNRIISVGYNGFPKGIKDDDRLKNRDIKYSIILHAEENCYYFAKTNLEGCTMYTWPMFSCSRCCAIGIQCGIKRFVSPYSDNERWKKSIELSISLCKEAGIKYNLVDFDPQV